MSTEKNVQTVKDFFAAIGRGDREGLLALVTSIREYIDTQALARASQMDASGLA